LVIEYLIFSMLYLAKPTVSIFFFTAKLYLCWWLLKLYLGQLMISLVAVILSIIWFIILFIYDDIISDYIILQLKHLLALKTIIGTNIVKYR